MPRVATDSDRTARVRDGIIQGAPQRMDNQLVVVLADHVVITPAAVDTNFSLLRNVLEKAKEAKPPPLHVLEEA
eukprot:14589321-Alexandrium_andersonii.AAC.1